MTDYKAIRNMIKQLRSQYGPIGKFELGNDAADCLQILMDELVACRLYAKIIKRGLKAEPNLVEKLEEAENKINRLTARGFEDLLNENKLLKATLANIGKELNKSANYQPIKIDRYPGGLVRIW